MAKDQGSFAAFSLIMGFIIGAVFSALAPSSTAQTVPPKASVVPVPLQCEKLYTSSMEYFKKEAGLEYSTLFAAKSAMYGIAYQNCITRGGK